MVSDLDKAIEKLHREAERRGNRDEPGEAKARGSEPFEDGRAYPRREEIPRCEQCGALIRPYVCWFGEVPFEMELILHQLGAATMVLTIGTSGVVEPAASFVRMARRNRAQTVYVGPEEPANRAFFDEVVEGKAGEVLPGLVSELGKGAW